MKKYLIVIICILCFSSCLYISNPLYKYRDTIHFNDSVEKVEANIVKLNSLFDKIREDYNDSIRLYYLWGYKDTSAFYFCDTTIRRLNFESIDKCTLTKGLTTEEKKELINSIEFLKSNYVTGMGMDLGNAYYYEYRFIENDSYFSRQIIHLNKTVDTNIIHNLYYIIDRKSDLILLKDKG